MPTFFLFTFLARNKQFLYGHLFLRIFHNTKTTHFFYLLTSVISHRAYVKPLKTHKINKKTNNTTNPFITITEHKKIEFFIKIQKYCITLNYGRPQLTRKTFYFQQHSSTHPPKKRLYAF